MQLLAVCEIYGGSNALCQIILITKQASGNIDMCVRVREIESVCVFFGDEFQLNFNHHFDISMADCKLFYSLLIIIITIIIRHEYFWALLFIQCVCLLTAVFSANKPTDSQQIRKRTDNECLFNLGIEFYSKSEQLFQLSAPTKE